MDAHSTQVLKQKLTFTCMTKCTCVLLILYSL